MWGGGFEPKLIASRSLGGVGETKLIDSRSLGGVEDLKRLIVVHWVGWGKRS